MVNALTITDHHPERAGNRPLFPPVEYIWRPLRGPFFYVQQCD
jgi:hypothetical protein